MPLFSITQLVGKTLYLKQSSRYYKVDNLSNSSASVGTLKAGSMFVVDSYLSPRPGRDNYYFTFFGSDGSYLAVAYENEKFSLSKLKEQGALTVIEEQDKNKSEWDKLLSSLKSNLDKLGKGGKTAFIVAFVLLAIYLLLPVVTDSYKKLKK